MGTRLFAAAREITGLRMTRNPARNVFGSDAVGDCGGLNNQNVLTEAAASEFVTGKEFQNDQFFYCYGIQTNSYGRRDYVSAKKLKFGFEDGGREIYTPCDPSFCRHCRLCGIKCGNCKAH